jgi:hypothetical protein
MIKIKYGTKSVDDDAVSSVNDILANDDLKAYLGFGESVEVVRSGDILDGSTSLYAGDTVILQKKANSKA